jgi:hypothetical protein
MKALPQNTKQKERKKKHKKGNEIRISQLNEFNRNYIFREII